MLVSSGPRAPDRVLWDAALKARMNVLYYEFLLLRLEAQDRWLRIASALLASAGVAAAIKLGGPGLAVAAGVVSGAIGVISPILALSDRIKNAAALLPKYVEHYQTLARLYEQQGARKQEDVDAALRALEQTEVMEAEKVRTSEKKLLDRAYAQACEEVTDLPQNCSPPSVVPARA